MKVWAVIAGLVIAFGIGAGAGAFGYREAHYHPCPAHHFAIIGDSNVYAMDLGAGCLNLGRSGDDTAQMAARFDARLIEAMQKTLIIWASNNDVHFWRDDGAANLRLMTDQAKMAGLKVILTTPLPLLDTYAVGGHTAAQAIAADRRLRDAVVVLGRAENVPVAPLYEALANPDGTPKRGYFYEEPDHPGTYQHLTHAGQRLVWRTLLPL